MQTNFTAEQLSDVEIARADEILRRCVHCGLCNATCPTYVLDGDERDSPRGRIYLIKHMLESGETADARVTTHIDRCLSCLSCMTTCPNDVNYMHLVDLARSRIEARSPRGMKDRLLRRYIGDLLSDPDRLRSVLHFARFAKPLAAVLKLVGLNKLAVMLAQLRSGRQSVPEPDAPAATVSNPAARKRVLLLAGCAQQVLRPQINEATIRLLTRRGVDVTVAPDAGCCGALDLGLGRQAKAKAFARRNIDAWMERIENGSVDAIIITASGCGTAVKDYAHLLKDEPDYADKAGRIAQLACDVTEFLSGHDLGPPMRWSSLRIAYHSACSMQHGQGIDAVPRALLSKAGFAVAEVPEGHICCGAAGAFNILQPEIATRLRQRKVENIERAKPDLVAAGSIGCIMQLRSGMDLPIAHTVELLDWAYGGPVPQGLEKLERLVNDVPQPEPEFVPPPPPGPVAVIRSKAAPGSDSAARNGKKKAGKADKAKKPAPVSA